MHAAPDNLVLKGYAVLYRLPGREAAVSEVGLPEFNSRSLER